jgi:hypothetical protein
MHTAFGTLNANYSDRLNAKESKTGKNYSSRFSFSQRYLEDFINLLILS